MARYILLYSLFCTHSNFRNTQSFNAYIFISASHRFATDYTEQLCGALPLIIEAGIFIYPIYAGPSGYQAVRLQTE
jgi:hypothetical protein